MKDQSKRNKELIEENAFLKEKIRNLEQLALDHKKAEETFKESETKYRLAFESTSDGIFTIDCNGNIASITPSVEKQLGYKVEEVINRPIQNLNILTSESLTRAISDVRQVLSGVEVTGAVYEFIAADGTRKIGEVTGTPIIREGRIIGVTAIVRDITERKKAEEALRQGYSFRKAIIDNVAEGLCVCHETTEYPFIKFTIWNDCMTRITGYTMGEINRLGWYQTVYPDAELQARAIERMKRMRQGENIRAEEWKITRVDGSKRVLSISTSVVESDDGIVHILALMQDITERKRMEEAYKESEFKYRSLIEHSSDVVFCVDQKGEYKFVNQVFASTFGKTPDYFLGKTFWDIYPKEHADHRQATSIKVFETGESQSVEVVVPLPDRTLYFIAKANPVRDETGKVVLNLTHATDITDRKLMEEALRESENRYRELSILDGLTQLYNSRHFYHQLKMERDRADRYGQPLTLMLLDLDDFKLFNDIYGHVEGDQVLLRLGQVVERCLRQTDTAYRYGGEEFTVLLPMTTESACVVTAERIRQEFKKETFSPTPGQNVHITLSIGLAQYKPQEDIKAFVHRVDQLMYQAKKDGKDRICTEP